MVSAASSEPRPSGPVATAAPARPRSSGHHATLVAAGVLLSRVAGLARQMLFARAFGTSVVAGAFLLAMRIPNFMQNLLGEGVLSASFIPVYAGLRAQRKDEEADDVAGAVFGLLALVVAVLAAVGIVAAPLLVRVIAPGFEGEARALTVELVRVIFPGTGLLVLSAWCLGILNSHRRFFLSYAAPVLMNLVVIAALLATWGRPQRDAIGWIAWATVLGGLAQFGVQVPRVLRLLGRFRPRPSVALASVRQVLTAFLPTVAARGVVNISAYTDVAFVSLISERAVAALANAQVVVMLPFSLFAMSITAAELPEMSSDAVRDHGERSAAIRARLTAALERMAYFVVPSAAAFLLLGDAIAGALLQSGHFSAADARYVGYILMGAGVGLLAQTSGRLYSSAFYALKDTQTPFRIAALRVGVGVALGYYSVRILPGQVGLPEHIGAVFITVSTGLSAWLELALLRRRLAREVGPIPSIRPRLLRLWAAALGAGGLALGLKALAAWKLGPSPATAGEWMGGVLPMPNLPGTLAPKALDAALLGAFGVAYLGFTLLLRIPQAQGLLRRVTRRPSPP